MQHMTYEMNRTHHHHHHHHQISSISSIFNLSLLLLLLLISSAEFNYLPADDASIVVTAWIITPTTTMKNMYHHHRKSISTTKITTTIASNVAMVRVGRRQRRRCCLQISSLSSTAIQSTINSNDEQVDSNDIPVVPLLIPPPPTVFNDDNSSSQKSQLLTLCQPSSSCKVDQMSGTDMAYIGDVVYELFVRTRTVWPLKRTSDLQQQVVALVRAEHQSKLLHKLRQENHDDNDTMSGSFRLTTKELQIMNRARNAASSRSKSGSHNRNHHPQIYQDSTALEALIGYLYISDMNRCTELFQWIESNIDTVV